jgi:predicted permease
METVEPAFDKMMDEVGMVFTIFAAVQIVGIISGFYVLRVLRKEKREERDQFVMFAKNLAPYKGDIN